MICSKRRTAKWQRWDSDFPDCVFPSCAKSGLRNCVEEKEPSVCMRDGRCQGILHWTWLNREGSLYLTLLQWEGRGERKGERERR